MSVAKIHLSTWNVPNLQAPSNISALPSVASFGYVNTINTGVETLSNNEAERADLITGLLFMPNAGQPAACLDATESYVPMNDTHTILANDTNYQYIALAPIVSADCTAYYLKEAQKHDIGAFLFFFPGNDPTIPGNVTETDYYGLSSNGLWRPSRFPVYAVPGFYAQQWVDQLAIFMGNITSILDGPNRTTVGQFPRLYAEISIGDEDALPSLWDFLLIAVAVLACILGAMSLVMHCMQRYRRRSLRRRVMTGEIDLESLGMKQMTVPRELLLKMPTYVFEEGKVAGLRADVRPLQEIVGKASEHDDNVETATATSSLPYAQLTCAICLDDFKANETTVREMPCRHVFHPECIDDFLLNNSSLCPLCKKSALPQGYCPRVITNSMVRRDRLLRYHQEQQDAATRRESRGGLELSGLSPPGRATRVLRRALGSLRPLPSTRSSFELPTTATAAPMRAGAANTASEPRHGPVEEIAPPPASETEEVAESSPPDEAGEPAAEATPARVRRSRTQRRRERGQQRALALLGDAAPDAAAATLASQGRSWWTRSASWAFPGFR